MILIVLMIPLVQGITFFANQPATLWASCKNNTYVNSSALLDIYYPNNTVWKSREQMTNVSDGIFNYTFIAPNVTGNYLTSVECNIGNVLGYDEDDFWVREKGEEMTSTAVVIFLVLITAGVFLLPKLVKKFSENPYLNFTLKGLTFIFGLFLLSLDTVIVVTVADNANLGISRELFRLLWLINWAAYISMVIVVLVFGYKMLKLWNINQKKRNSGEIDFNEEQ